jgi:hypothetical protein
VRKPTETVVIIPAPSGTGYLVCCEAFRQPTLYIGPSGLWHRNPKNCDVFQTDTEAGAVVQQLTGGE